MHGENYAPVGAEHLFALSATTIGMLAWQITSLTQRRCGDRTSG